MDIAGKDRSPLIPGQVPASLKVERIIIHRNEKNCREAPESNLDSRDRRFLAGVWTGVKRSTI